MDSKKICFSFIKTKKIDNPKKEEQKEYIESVEDKTIKVVGGEVKNVSSPTVIPVKPNRQRVVLVNDNKTSERSMKKAEVVTVNIDTAGKNCESDTLEQMAVRELIAEAREEIITEPKHLTLPISNKFTTDGAVESTLDDYKIIPVQDFGMAMLRGMGWNPGQQTTKSKVIELRPKGLGLGAHKVSYKNKTNKGEELTITKNSYVKITSGKHSGFYGKVISLNDDIGHAIVEVTQRNKVISVSDFLLQPVTKSEYDEESKNFNKELYRSYTQETSNDRCSLSSFPSTSESCQIITKNDVDYDAFNRKYADNEPITTEVCTRPSDDSSSSESS